MVILTVALASPVAALSFDFQYFETDKMTYEVGETIGMVAKMIADYEDGGWCYVSFAVVTDKGPVFNDAYFISPSPDVRYFTSSYTIIPENTSPFPDPVTAYVIFNVEIFDKYSQGASETIEVNITRGRIQARAITPLLFESNENASTIIGMASRYNENVGYANQSVLVEIYNSTSALIYSNLTRTDSLGNIDLEWSSIPYPPGTYSLEVSGNGTTAFLPFSESLEMIIEPEHSSINIVNVSDNIYCQTPSGANYQNVELAIDHLDRSSNPINDSEIKWETSFASGNLTNQGDGRYTSSIPFITSPGLYDINITAVHFLYQNATDRVWVNVLPRRISAIITSEQILQSNLVKTTVALMDWQAGELLDALPISVNLSLNNWSFQVLGFSNTSGMFSCISDVPITQWGIGMVRITSNVSQYYEPFEITKSVEISYIPQIFTDIQTPTARGEIVILQITIQDPLGFPTSSIPIEVLDPLNNTVASGYTNSSGIVVVNWSILLDAALGLHNYSIHISNNTEYVQTISVLLPVTVYHPLWVTPTLTNWNFVRGNTTLVEVFLETETGISSSIPILFNDSMGEFSKYIMLTPSSYTNILFDIGYNITPGLHTLKIIVFNASFILLETESIQVTVQTEISTQITNISAFFEESISFDLFAIDDQANEIETVGIIIYLQGNSTQLVSIEDSPTNITQSLILPPWVSPGSHQIEIEVYGPWSTHQTELFTITIWIRTKLDISITIQLGGQMLPANQTTYYQSHYQEILDSISSGPINLPPPTLVSDTTSADMSTDFDTSPDNCPIFSSGTNNLSTVCENSLNSLLGNGQSVLNLKDLKEELLSIIASSTDLEVHPKEIIPHAASAGPEITKSVMKSSFFCILFSSL